jgi:nucleotide-binding universal stress UspA family protein
VGASFAISEQTPEVFHPIDRDTAAAPAPLSADPPFDADSCVLALADATAEGTNAVWRAAVVARDLGVPLRVLLVAVGDDQLPSVRALARRLARDALRRLGVPATGTAASGDMRRLLAEVTPPPAVLVLPYKRGNALAECLFGPAAERMFQAVFTPTLVVKLRASTSYQRVLVPAKLDHDAMVLMGAARYIARNPRVLVMHVLDTAEEQTLRIADAPEHVLRAQRLRRSNAAYRELDRLIAAPGAGGEAAAQVSFGYAPVRVLEAIRARRAQLVVLGKQRSSLFGRWLADGVSQRVISQGGADVLLLPLSKRTRVATRRAAALS